MIQVPSRSSIVLAQQHLLREIGIKNNKFATQACWACITEDENKSPIRARISPKLDERSPHSYFLLCLDCHSNRPQEEEESVQLSWIIETSTSPSLENVSAEFMSQTNMSLVYFIRNLKHEFGMEELAGYLTEKLTKEMNNSNGTRREVFLNMLLNEYAATTKRGNQDH